MNKESWSFGDKAFLWTAAVAVILVAGITFADWDTVPQPKPAQDIIDALMVVPTPTLNQFGHTERTRVIFNIAKLLEVLNQQETRIKALEDKVAKLTKPVDPNEVVK